MQSLWSRAGQAHRGGCRVCDSAIGALGRRVTTAATRPRKPTFAEVFTACYSTMFASAAVVDAIRKEDRRQDLDRQLEDARRELAEAQMIRALETKRISANLDVDEPGLTDYQMEELWASLKDIYTSRPFMKDVLKPIAPSVSELLARLHEEHYHKPSVALMRSLRQTNYTRIELAIKSEETDPSIKPRSPITKTQLHQDSRAIVGLVNRLYTRVRCKTSSHESSSLDEAKQLADRFTQRFTYPSMDTQRAERSRVLLNQLLRDIINSGLEIKEVVGRVCYNILVAPHPPDIHTFNTLIVAFDKSQNYKLAEDVAHSFFFKRRISPTPSTFVALANHYRDSNEGWKFLRTIACITGLDTLTGCKLGRRPVEEVEKLLAGKDWWIGKGMTRTGDWVYKNFPLDRPLLEALIKGLLHFSLFEQAATLFVSCMNANVLLDRRILKQLLDECILALDWSAAVRLVRGFTNCQDSISLVTGTDRNEDAYLVNRLRVLVDICGLTAFGAAVSESALSNLNISSTRFGQFLEALAGVDGTSEIDMNNSNSTAALPESATKLLQFESISRELELVQRAIQGIETKLLYSDFPLEFRISMALHIVESTTQTSLQLNEECGELFSQMIPLRGMAKQSRECTMWHKMTRQIDRAKTLTIDCYRCHVLLPLSALAPAYARHATPLLFDGDGRGPLMTVSAEDGHGSDDGYFVGWASGPLGKGPIDEWAVCGESRETAAGLELIEHEDEQNRERYMGPG
ncbi:hypothetical protein B0J13DRAFT_597790 [Dactylonectria estremocensis]|uniref:Pentatricopeptide repeat domain-containing protein n=1 Tax=Dactylonectria estremocensis TaxID=1079267 RepID=A0A9P9E9W5_9HYPO|nr:hypothetical protein B0J13DRAFT_597790 [Dactylonectria estremocensis]